jgi:hypothetical protein
VALVRTDVSEERSASFIRVTRLGELGTTLAATSNRRTLRRNTITSQKIPFFIVTAVKTSNLTTINVFYDKEWCLLGCYAVKTSNLTLFYDMSQIALTDKRGI